VVLSLNPQKIGKDEQMSVHHVVVGNLNIDITIFIERIPGPDESSKADKVVLNIGGAAVNYSVAASRYGHKSHLVGVTTNLFEKMGLLEEIERRGVNTSNVVVVSDGMPGISIILQPPEGQRRIISYRGGFKKFKESNSY
jgi:ribokinase